MKPLLVCSSGKRRLSWQTALVVVVALAAALTFAPARPGWQLVRYLGAMALLWGLPTWGWARALPRWMGGRARLELWAIGGGVALVQSGLLTLLLYLLPGAFPLGWARLLYALLALLPVALSLWRPAPALPPWQAWERWLLGALLVAALARGFHLSYSEFQGDEAVIMQRAAQALAPDVQSPTSPSLFLHQKGPVEILIPMSLWALSGTINEWQARLPFTLVGVLAVLSVALLTWRWYGGTAAVIAGYLLAISGFLVAFGRIVQYQNVVVACGALGLLALAARLDSGKRLSRPEHGRWTGLLLGAIFLAYGLLAHYDIVLVGPAALLLVAGGLWARRAHLKQEVARLVLAGVVALAIIALFYVPFTRDPMFARTFAYLTGGRLGGDGLFHNSLTSVWRMSTFYNSLYYLAVLAVGIALALLTDAHSPRPWGPLWAGAAWLYFLVPLFFYTFIVADPRTHIYTFYPGAALLAGGGWARAWRWLRERGARYRYAALLLAGAWYALCAGHVALVYVAHGVEYKRAWPESRHPLYPVPFADDELPLYGHFGFPYRAGWKAVEQLFATGVLQGTYASNEEPEVTSWYMRSGARTMCGQPDYYVTAVNVQDEIAIDWEAVARDYTPVAQIRVRGQPKITVHGRRGGGEGLLPAVEVGVPLVMDARAAIVPFDAGTTVDAQVPRAPTPTYSTDIALGDVARLLGYDLSATRLHPGMVLRVTLYWQALSSPHNNYQVFVHLIAGEHQMQHDGAPACAHAPTSLWERGEFVRDEHMIWVPAEVPPGEAQLYVGMYDVLSFARLPIAGVPDDRVLLQQLEIVPDAE